MLQSVSIRNFQSLKSIDLDLGPLTVVVGDSSSGKSALLRALRMLVCNERGSWFVTNGESTSSVSAKDNRSVVTLEKGVSNSGEYRIHTEGSPTPNKTFTKLASSVPTDVSEALGVFPSGPNFAFQFDPPFLLKESGAAVAAVLGELTGVSKIFEAAQEANRKRLAASRLLKTRTSDLEEVLLSLDKFENLEASRDCVARAELAYSEHLEVQGRRDSLTALLLSLEQCRKAFLDLKVPALPDLSEVANLTSRRSALASLLREIDAGLSSFNAQSKEISSAKAAKNAAETEYHEVLVQAGRCPTCQQSITA